ncbi:MAG: YceI family protein [Ilumatobacteraceae bacterium]
MSKKVVVIAAIISFLLVAAVVGPWLYINVIKDDPPPRLTLDTVPAETTTSIAVADAQGIDGEWSVAAGSVVGYRVKEILLGQDSEGVGRSNAVTGSLLLSETQVDAAEFAVEISTIRSDSSRRDSQFTGRIMDAATFPTASFKLSAPISLDSEISVGTPIQVQATGDLTLRGVTKSVTFPIDAQYDGSTIQVAGSIDVVFADWGIPNPSNAVVTTQEHGLLEFLLTFTR